MLKKAFVAFSVTCVFLLLANVASASNNNIVLYATDSSNLHGNWTLVADATAAGGQAIASADKGWSNTVGPLSAPPDYVDFAFAAPAGTKYHVWLRMRATSNSKYNDSVFAQFSDAIDGSGAAILGIGGTNGLAINLASDSVASSLSAWGWQDGAYWLTQPTIIAFAGAGTHTLRIQTREDGVSIDQVVLSPVDYFTTAPGALSNDATIVPKPASTVVSLPAPWSGQDIGSTGLAGSASLAGGLFTVTGAGADIWDSVDAFQFASQAVSGDAQILARVTSLQNTSTYAKAGVMFRDAATAGSAHVLLDVRPNGSLEFMMRAAAGAPTVFIAGGTGQPPAWLRLTRSGTTFTGEVSMDGVTWTLVGRTTVALSANALVGLAVTSHDAAHTNTATFDGVAVTRPPSAPGLPTPVDTATGISVSPSLSWTAAGAASYDVTIGSANPPTQAPTTLTTATYTPAALVNGVTYFWQVTARNAAGTTAGPVWSFTAVIAPPAVPAVPAPTAGATSVAIGTRLIWNAPAGATSYDVRFGSTNPPPLAATGLPSALFAPALSKAAIYYWQVIARNAGGVTAGPLWSFATVTTSDAPTAYNAITDRNTYVKPALPAIGPAGFEFNDPTFGSVMLRVTDGHTRQDAANTSFRVPSNSQLAVWNASSTAFVVESNDGTIIPYAFNAATRSATRMQPSSTGSGGLTLGFYVEPQFSLSDPNLIFGAVTGTNNRTIAQFDFKSGLYTTIVDLDAIVSGLANTYIGNVMTGGTSPEKLITLFGAASQDSHYYVMWAPLGNMAARKILNTRTSTINGVPTNIPLNFLLHSSFIDKSGRFVFIGPRSVDLAAPRSASEVYVWDTDTDTIVSLTSVASGHGAAGYGAYVNQDCCTISTWDAAQWQFRDLTDVGHTRDLIAPVLATKEVYLSDHTTWGNARADALVPIISSTFRYGANTTPWRAWDDEIIAVDTDRASSGLVYRFAHHRSNVVSDTDPNSSYYWYQPIANVSPNGQWVIFTSNWEKTLGKDSREGTARQDVFLVHLTPQ